MNPLIAEARTTVDGMWLMGFMTAAFLVFFVGWIVWAWWPSRRSAMEAAALMPFDDATDYPAGADRAASNDGEVR